MAENLDIPVVLRAVDKMSSDIKKLQGAHNKSISDMERRLTSFSTIFKAVFVGRVMNAAISGLKKLASQFTTVAVQVASVQEKVENRLNAAIKQNANVSDLATKSLIEYAAALQKVTTFGDETIIETEALISRFAKTESQIKAATKATLDMSIGMGVDLKAAAILLGKALEGETSSLSRYGIKIKEGLKESERFDAVMTELNKKFGGAAQAELETFSGKMASLGNVWGDHLETLGFAITKNEDVLAAIESVKNLLLSEEFKSAVISAAESFAAFASAIAKTIDNMHVFFGLFPDADILEGQAKKVHALQEKINESLDRRIHIMQMLESHVPGFTEADLEAENKKVTQLIKSLQVLRASLEGRAIVERDQRLSVSDGGMDTQGGFGGDAGLETFGFQGELDMFALLNDSKLEMKEKFNEDMFALEQSLWEMTQQSAQNAADYEAGLLESRVGAAQNMFGAMAQMAESFGDKGFKAAKGFAIAEALINTYQAITKALAESDPFTKYVQIAAAAAIGFAQVNKIRSTNPGGGGGGSVSIGAGGAGGSIAPTRRPVGDLIPKNRIEESKQPATISVIIEGNVIGNTDFADKIADAIRKRVGDGRSFGMRAVRV